MFYVSMAHAVPVSPIVQPHVTFVTGAGLPCAGCKLYSYSAGTTTPLATFTDASGVSQNTNPIILDAAGGANIWLSNASYKLILKDALGTTIWTVDMVPGGGGLGGVCGTAGAVQIANTGGTGLTCDTSITINTTNHTLNVGTLGANYVTIGPLGTATRWTFDTTTPATALASLGGGTVTSGLANQIAIYSATGSVVVGSSSVPDGVTVITRAPGDNTADPASTAFVALPGPIAPTSLQIASGIAMTANQGNGTSLQHSTGTPAANDCTKFDANGNTIDAGFSCTVTPTTCNTNGCYRIAGDGTIEQWGPAPGCGSGGTCGTGVTFPIPFPTAVKSVQATLSVGNSSWNVVANSQTLSGFTISYGPLTYVGGSGVNLDGSERATWFAIGN